MSLLAGTPGDYIEEAAIERRRQIERERLMRIKDPRQWKVGVDTDALAAQTVEQLAAGALKLTAKIARTVNELEEGVVSGAKVVTYFVVEVNQMNFTWELRRRYSQFASFHEALSEQARPPRVRPARPPTARQRARAALPCGCGVPTACDICDSTGASRHARGARPLLVPPVAAPPTLTLARV